MAKKKGAKSNHANLPYLLSRATSVHKWLVDGYTFSDIAKKLGVSRSWLFEQMKSNPELDELRKDALAERSENINNTLYRLATGNYKTRVLHTKSVTVTEDGNSRTIVTTTEDVLEHEDDPNMSALGMLTRQMSASQAASAAEPTIDDTITEVDADKFSYVDVANLPDNN